jgi:hypothetical protein
LREAQSLIHVSFDN